MQFVYYQVDKFIILILQQFLEKSVASPSNKYNCSLIITSFFKNADFQSVASDNFNTRIL